MSPRLIFVGAPGSGKTTIGKIVAKNLDSDFIDVDQEIEMDEKITINTEMVNTIAIVLWARFLNKCKVR